METTESQRHARTREVFLAVCDLPEGELLAALSLACADDMDLLTSVRSLLAGEKDTAFLASPVVIRTEEADVPEQVGEYLIIGLLGRGGSAVVYEAQQDRPRRRVALKVLRSVWASPSMIKRLELEGEALGRLQHPGIAAVYGVGTADGSPYLAMELVRGVSLTRYAKDQRLGLRQRLDLFAGVCDAVQHAHQRGVIHRDLKPGNILVDEEGRAKIVDFGVARLGEWDPQGTMHTEVGSVVGTLAYMSPEQAAGDVRQVDARTDVYSLGAILYELLSSQTPVDVAGKPIEGALGAVRAQRPELLGRLDRQLRGDLETIAGKALDKEPQSRYQAASDLATDVRRHLANETILARPPSVVYEAGRFARRHKGSLAVAVGAALLLGAAAWFLMESYDRLARAWKEWDAKQVDQALGAVTTRLMPLAEATDPSRGFVAALLSSAPEDQRPVALAAAVKALNATPLHVGDGPARSGLYRAIGTAYYYDLHLPGDAVAPFEKALSLYRSERPDVDEQQARMLVMLGSCLLDIGRAAEAAARLGEALAYAQHAELTEKSDYSVIARTLGRALIGAGKPDDAAAVLQDAVDHERTAHGGAPTDLMVECLSLRGDALRRAKRPEEARRTLSDATGLAVGLEDGERKVLQPRSYLARVEADLGHLDEAERLQQEVIRSDERLFGNDSKETVTALIEVSNTLWMAKPKRLDDAEEALRWAHAISKKGIGLSPLAQWVVADHLAKVLAALAGKAEECARIRAEADELRAQVDGVHPAPAVVPSTLSNSPLPTP